MGMDQYAIHRGCSKVAVWKKIQSGKISAERFLTETGRQGYRIDPTIADAEWLQNTRKHSGTKQPKLETRLPRGRPTKAHKDAIQVIRDAADIAKAEAKAEKDAVAPGNFVQQYEVPRKSKQGPQGPKSGNEQAKTGELHEEQPMTVGQRKMLADTLKAEAQAEREQLALAREKGELVSAEETEDRFAGMVANARDSFMHLSNGFRVTFQECPPECAQWIDDRVSSILDGLSKGITENG